MRAVNLIPSDDRGGAGITAGRSGGGVIVIAGLLAGLAVLALLYGLADHQISSNRSEVASLTARAQQAQVRAGELAPYTSFLQMREQRVQAVTTLVDSRFDWAQAFHELGRVLPAGKVSLDSIEGTVGSTAAATPASSSTSSATNGSSVTSATPPGSIPVFKLTGCAVSQAEVALMLERLRLIDGVVEVSLQSSTQAAASGAGSGSGGGCAGGNPSFTAQVTFDALPAIPASGTSAGTGSSTSASSTSVAASSTSVATSSTAATTSAPASTATTTSTPTTTTSTPAASAASASSSGAVR